MYKKKGSLLLKRPQRPPMPSPLASLPPAIKGQALKAIEEMRIGNLVQALEVIKECIGKHSGSPHLAIIEAQVFKLLAENCTESYDEKINHLYNASVSAYTALHKKKNSISFALKFLDILYALASISNESNRIWIFAYRTCQYALAIKDPDDPAVDNIFEADEMLKSSKESRINDAREKIRKFLSVVEPKAAGELVVDKMNALETLVVDYMNALETVFKECRVEISHFVPNQLKSEYKAFWKRLAPEVKGNFLEVSITELETHFKSLQFKLNVEFAEVVRFAKKHGSWKYWKCHRYSCENTNFASIDEYRNHYSESHRLLKQSIECLKKELQVNQQQTEIILQGNWIGPVCDKSKSGKVLLKIRNAFQLLLRKECLSKIQFMWAVFFTLNKQQVIVRRSQLQGKDLQYICGLKAFELEKILEVPINLAHTCGFVGNTEREGSICENYHMEDRVFEGKQRLGFSRNFTFVLLEECLFRTALNAGGDTDDFITWLYDCPVVGKGLEPLVSLLELRRKKAVELSRMLEKEYLQLQSLLIHWWRIDRKIKAIWDLEDMYVKDIENVADHAARSYPNLLRQQHEELQTKHDIESKTKMEIITSVLEEGMAADTLVVLGNNESGVEETNNSMRLILQRINKDLFEEVALVDAKLLSRAHYIQKCEQILEKMSVCDYESIFVTLYKSLLQTHLEDLYGKDVKNKKNSRKAEEYEETNDAKNSQFHQRDEEESLVPCSSDHPVLATVVPVIADDHKQQVKEVTDRESVHRMQSLVADSMLECNLLGAGLKNDGEDNNCFLNVIIQSLWHLGTFRKKFNQTKSDHSHVGNPCIVCALHGIFDALHTLKEESVSPAPLRIALSNFHKDDGEKKFQMEEPADASEVLESMLLHLHNSYAFGCEVHDPAPARDVSSNLCLSHHTFGIKIKIHRDSKSRDPGHFHPRSISEAILIDPVELERLKSIHGNHSFNEFVKQEVGSMVKRGIPDDVVASWLPPQVLRIVIQEDISETFKYVSTELNIEFKSDHVAKYILISMVCYSAKIKHYICVIYNCELQKYVAYNDSTVEELGNWVDVINMCTTMGMQPTLLLFEDRNRQGEG